MKLKREEVIAACRSSLLPCIHIRPAAGEKPGPADCKFGGDFYLPAGAVPPEMEFLAQINFTQVPRLEGFPDKGLLQFFLCTEDEKFEAFYEDGCAWKQDAGFFQVRWYPEVPEDAPACENAVPDKRWQLDSPEGSMTFESTEEIATISIGEDGGFAIDLGYESLSDVLTPIFQAAWEEDDEPDDDEDEDEDMEEDGKEEEEGVYDLENSCEDTDRFAFDFGNWGFKLGGHPSLRQGEFRLDEENYQAYSALLFQYDLTDAPELERDTFSFFIRPEDLKARRFDDILMTYHNCF